MTWSGATPPTIPGSLNLKSESVETLQVFNNLNVEGDITCNSLTATTTVTAGTGMTSTTGNIVATAGAVSAGTTVTGGTGISATTGNITAVAGSLVSNTANVNAATGCNIGFGGAATLDLGSNATAAVVNVGDATASIGFFGTTANVQPTTGIVGGVFVANTSGITDGTATYGGYTVGQVVSALQRLGLLA